MKQLLILGLIAPCVTAAAAAAPDRPVRRESSSQLELRFDQGGTRTVDLRTISGSIRLTTAARDTVQLRVTRTTHAEREAELATADREVRLDALAVGATIQAIVHDGEDVCGEPSVSRRDSWWDRRRYDVRVDLEAVVPAGTRVRLCTINGGEIVATGSLGEFDVSNVNGRIELAGVRGSGRAHTVNGPVAVTFSEAPRDASEFTTVNGDVIVTLPRTTAANLRLKTFHGELLTDFDTEQRPREPQPIRQVGGRLVYGSGGFTTVRIGGGGPELSFDTLNGDVRVLRAAR
jgi:hypothetical protein